MRSPAKTLIVVNTVRRFKSSTTRYVGKSPDNYPKRERKGTAVLNGLANLSVSREVNNRKKWQQPCQLGEVAERFIAAVLKTAEGE